MYVSAENNVRFSYVGSFAGTGGFTSVAIIDRCEDPNDGSVDIEGDLTGLRSGR